MKISFEKLILIVVPSPTNEHGKINIKKKKKLWHEKNGLGLTMGAGIDIFFCLVFTPPLKWRFYI